MPLGTEEDLSIATENLSYVTGICWKSLGSLSFDKGTELDPTVAELRSFENNRTAGSHGQMLSSLSLNPKFN